MDNYIEIYFDEEEYKLLPIIDTAGHYEVSTYGNVCSTQRKKFGRYVRKQQTNPDGYKTIGIDDVNGKRWTLGVHVLVAMTWLNYDPWFSKKEIVNHKNGNKADNRVSNLEVITQRENVLHAIYVLGHKKNLDALAEKCKRSVCQLTSEGELVNRFSSINEAGEITGIQRSDIGGTCTGQKRSAGGFLWVYAENYKEGEHKMRKQALTIPVDQYTQKGVFIRSFDSRRDAAQYLFDRKDDIKCRENIKRKGRKGPKERTFGGYLAALTKACTGEKHSFAGFIWKYKPNPKPGLSDLEIETADWKIDPDFPGYKFSRDIRVYSIFRKKLRKISYIHGYPVVTLRRPDHTTAGVLVHRMVAKLYIDNPQDKPFVNHIDGKKDNPQDTNLEWVTAKENSRHAFDTGLNKNVKAVIQMDMITKVDIASFISIASAARALCILDTGIGVACRNGTTCGGFRWRYA